MTREECPSDSQESVEAWMLSEERRYFKEQGVFNCVKSYRSVKKMKVEN